MLFTGTGRGFHRHEPRLSPSLFTEFPRILVIVNTEERLRGQRRAPGRRRSRSRSPHRYPPTAVSFALTNSAVAANRKGAVPKLKGAAKTSFVASTQGNEWFTALVIACQDRALLGAKPGPHLAPTLATASTLAAAVQDVAAYCAVYTQYLIRLMTESALPEANDSGDLELLLYSVDDDHLIVTSERKWKTLATKANCPQRVLLV